ncbi:15357_t:CDS:2 [Entrophospora sp. SA101]|nr:15855_t:CDS:2 [Entrophospora sp. SA101]CAJ0749331.1 15357_t:CDS:2 [Entrophospora sp. SA101]CAJ0834037.1 9587_t:CDS:2 [Entrophospora sp. SA101]
MANEPKLQMEFVFENEHKYTAPPSDKSSKKASWNESILLNLQKLDSVKESELIIRCWDNSVKGPDGVIIEAKENLYRSENYERSENAFTLNLQTGKNQVELTFKIYFVENKPPENILQRVYEEEERIGIILITGLKYKDMCGMSGFLEFKLDKEKHSTKDYWTTSKSELKSPVSLFLVDKISTLTIYCVLSSSQGCPTDKIKIGPSNDKSEKLWDNLTKLGYCAVGPVILSERGMDYSSVEFLLSLHTILSIDPLTLSPPPSPSLPSSPVFSNINIDSTSNIEIIDSASNIEIINTAVTSPFKSSYPIPPSPTTTSSSSISLIDDDYETKSNRSSNIYEPSFISRDSINYSTSITSPWSSPSYVADKQTISDKYFIKNRMTKQSSSSIFNQRNKIFFGENIKKTNDIVIIKIFSDQVWWQNEVRMFKKLMNIENYFEYLVKCQEMNHQKEYYVVTSYMGNSLDMIVDRFKNLQDIKHLFFNVSPELLLDGDGNSKVKANYLHDIYSLGCLLYFLLTKRPLYTSKEELDVIMMGNMKEKIKSDINNEIASGLINWMTNPVGRPKIDVVLQSKFFKE